MAQPLAACVAASCWNPLVILNAKLRVARMPAAEGRIWVIPIRTIALLAGLVTSGHGAHEEVGTSALRPSGEGALSSTPWGE